MRQAAATLWRLVRSTVIIVGIVAIVAIAVGYVLAARSTPDYARSFTLPGPEAEIEIVRDAFATPHIFAETEADAYFGLGFVHAQDRLWQMVLRRRLVQGRVSEMAGAFASLSGQEELLFRVDVTMRALDLNGYAMRAYERQTPETQSALQSYAAGVNAWLDVIAREGHGGGAPELLLLGVDVEPWRPEDSIAAFKMLAATLSASPFVEIRNTQFLIAQGKDRAEDLFPQAPGGAITALPPFAALFGDEVEFAAMGEALGGLDDWPYGLNAGDFAGASNAWAVAGDRSSTRAPLLASDPHLPLSAPSVWYLARLEFPDGGVIGGTIAGIPAVLAGRNAHIAWAPTSLYADTADFFMETVNPDNPEQYRTPTGWAEFETRSERIVTGDGSAVEITLRSTRHGPLLPLDWKSLAAITPKGKAPALSWTLLTDDDRSLAAALLLMRARSLDAAMTLANDVVAPPQMMTIADRRRIATFGIGRTPERRPDSQTRGRVVSPGWRSENDWVGWFSSDALPRAIDPDSGIVANANNRVTNEAFPRHLGYEWPAPYRIERLAKLLNNREFHTLNGFKAIQNDTVSEMARSVLPLIAGPLWRDSEAEIGARREALDLLAEWNGDMDPFQPEPLIFQAWLRALAARLTAHPLGELAEDFEGVRPLFIERVFRDIDGAAGRWCDDTRTGVEETCADISSLALDDALGELQESFGGALSNLRWGRAHQALHNHQPFGSTPLGFLVNIAQETGGGDHTLQRGQTRGRGDAPYRNVHAAGFRAIYDFADLDRSVVAIATGQSGHFLSRHYDDLAEIWRAGDYIPLSLNRQDAEAGAVGITRLTPAP